MKRAPFLLSCAIAATTTTVLAADVQNEDFIFESFMFDQLYPLASDGERLLVEDPWPGVVHLAVFSPEGHSGDDWLPDSIIKIPPDEPGCDSWLEKAELSGDHAALLLWDEDQESYSTRVFYNVQNPIDDWNEVMQVTNSNSLPSQYEMTDMELEGPELIVAFANQDADGTDSGALAVYRANGSDWTHEYTLDVPVPEEPSVYVGGGNWMRFPSSFSVQVEGDTMIVIENTKHIQDITYTWLYYPILHTFHRTGNTWTLEHSMRFQPSCASEMMMDKGEVTATLQFQDNRMVLLRRQECRSQDYAWQTSESIREYNWNEPSMSWTMTQDPFDMPAAHQVTMLDSERVILQHDDEGVHEYHLQDNGTWFKALTFEPSNSELTITSLVATDSILFARTEHEDHDPVNGPVLGFELHNGGNGADIDGDGTVGVNDVLSLIAAWGSDSEAADINGDGIVDVDDLLDLLMAFEG